MFRDYITSTALTGDIPNMSLGHINGIGFRNDVSFVASARAFLYKRMQDGESIRIIFDTRGEGSWRAIPISDNTLYICNVGGLKDQSTKTFAEIDEGFTSAFAGFEAVPKIRAFYERSFAARCFVNKATKTSVVFADHIDMRTLHFLECSILIMLPWYHEREPKLSDDETALVKCLMNKGGTSSEYLKCIEAIASQFDFRTTAIKSMLSGFETRYKQIQLDAAKNKVSEISTRIENLLNEVGNFVRDREEALIRLRGLEETIRMDAGGSELVDFFLAHKNIELAEVRDRMFKIVVKTQYSPVSIQDADEMRKMIDNSRSLIYINDYGEAYDGRNGICNEDMKMLMNAIFVDGVLKLNMCGALKIDASHQYPFGISGYRYGAGYADYMPNTHIDKFGCTGQYDGVLADLLTRGDYIQATATCITATGSLNFGDSPVMHCFMDAMWGSDRVNTKAIVLPDGRVCKPKEAIAWLKEQKGE